MSAIEKSDDERIEEKLEGRLEKLYAIREELQLVAESDLEYAKYAETGLERLREAGYDV